MTFVFETSPRLDECAEVKKGLSTGKNELFLRLWWEVEEEKTSLNNSELSLKQDKKPKWFPYNKGGEFRKWYGNDDYLINWEDNGRDLKLFPGSILRNQNYYFQPSVTWSDVSSGCIAFRVKEGSGLHDGAGASFFASPETRNLLLGIMNSSCVKEVSKVLSPTLHFEIGQVSSYPVRFGSSDEQAEYGRMVEDNVIFSKEDWDSNELSWGFEKHPLI